MGRSRGKDGPADRPVRGTDEPTDRPARGTDEPNEPTNKPSGGTVDPTNWQYGGPARETARVRSEPADRPVRGTARETARPADRPVRGTARARSELTDRPKNKRSQAPCRATNEGTSALIIYLEQKYQRNRKGLGYLRYDRGCHYCPEEYLWFYSVGDGYTAKSGYAHLASGLCCGFSSLVILS